jgi:hypothetical protein
MDVDIGHRAPGTPQPDTRLRCNAPPWLHSPRAGGGSEPSASRLRPYLALRSFIVFRQKIRTKGSELSTPESGMRWPYKTNCMGIISSADESTHCRNCRLGVCDGYHVLRSARSALMPRVRTTDGACAHNSTPCAARNIWFLLCPL